MRTVQSRSWYRMSSLTMLAMPVAMANSCCSVILLRKPLNMKMLGAITMATLFRVILLRSLCSMTRWRNSNSAWSGHKGSEHHFASFGRVKSDRWQMWIIVNVDGELECK